MLFNCLVPLMKFIVSIMLLLLTFITHTLLSYINSRIGGGKKLSNSSIRIETKKLNETTKTTTTTNTPQQTQQKQAPPPVDDLEPELFQFNESFDVQLLNLKRGAEAVASRRSPLHSNSDSSVNYLLSSSSTSSLTHTDLIRNLNKLYNNEHQLAMNSTSNNTQLAVDYFDNAHYDEEFQLDDIINSTALFLGSGKNSSAQFDLTASAANATIIGANPTTNGGGKELDSDDEEEYFFNEKSNLFRTFIHQSVLATSSFNNENNVESTRLFFAPSIFRLSPKQSASNKSGLHKFRNRKAQTKSTTVKKSAKRSVAFKKSTRRARNKLNLKSKPIERLLTNLEPAFVKMPAAANNNQFYKRSFKVEKLLNDSRGMKKYLIDYDCMFSVTTASKVARPVDDASMSMHEDDRMSSNVSMCGEIELALDSTDMFGLDFLMAATVKPSSASATSKMNQSNSFSSSSSNRCSSGYLSDSN